MPALDVIDTWPVPAAGAGSLAPDGTVRTAGEPDRPFPLASVTKPLVALAVLVAVEEGVVALDQPAGPPGATLAHLLAHASGLAPDDRSAIAPVGARRIYSNAGFEVLAELVGESAGMPFGQYLAEAVLEPLGMAATSLVGSPAHGATSTVGDLLRLAGELRGPTLIHADTLARATTPAFPDLPGVLPGYGLQSPNPWGLGFEVRGHKAPHWTGSANSPQTFGHFGRSGTFLWVDPVAGVALVALTDREFGPWATTAWPALSDAVLAELTA